MISVEEAKKLIEEYTERLIPVTQELSKSLNQVLAEDILSPINYPPFDQSAMDGYAIVHSDILKGKEIQIVGEAPAGNPYKEVITSGQSVNIFTGGKVPEGADTVIIQENVTADNRRLIVNNSTLSKGANIRTKGFQIKKGDIALKKGTPLNPGAIGFLAGLGITEVNVFQNPKIALIVTGSELQKPGTPLGSGQVYESNSFALKSALRSVHIDTINVISIGDDEEATKNALSSAIQDSDLVIVSGGISVGKYDFVGKCLREIGVEDIFYKIYQKPGKPLFFGKKKDCLIFGLPGNPASALNCFYEYVYSSLQIMRGFSELFLEKMHLPITSDCKTKKGFSIFLKGKASEGKVDVLTGQESSNIGAFAHANCIIYLTAEKEKVKTGDMVEVHFLP